ncbi:MAG: Carboxylic acid reductase [Lentisphaerae bacterium ADurb.Bin242]|nr:MAG: Carboxylic acid reductase [Lentisphaerae bacterium ADurb.Bin242]
MKLLLTGITGLVGASFVTAVLRKRDDIEIVAVCRSGRGKTAAERARKVIEEQCEFDGVPELADHMLSHVKVIAGDVSDFPVREIIANGPYDVFFHCAADVNLGKDPEGKTFRTNLNGTRNALALAHLLKVKELHYVSTAYVAGTTAGRVMEGALPATAFNNSYEKSKFEAEKLVRECGIPYTIYRPSIIVGRLSDGLIRKPLAFYRIMEFLGKFKKHYCIKHGIALNSPIQISLRLESKISDKIYFVPIDYVQKAISTIFFKPVKNKCYHITGESPVSTKNIERAIASVLKVKGLQVQEVVENPTMDEKLVQRMIEDLMPYFASQIIFDNTQVKAALGKEALAWKQDLPFLKRMATSFYKQTAPELVAK